MSKERWEDLQRLFFELVDLEGEVRTARLAETAETEPELYEPLRRLLAASNRTDELLGRLEDLISHPPDLAAAPATHQTSPVPDPHGLIGRTISHYEVVDLMGAGGMGVLYKAVDTRLSRTVALKFLPPQWGLDETFKKRFLREARAAAALDDTNVCTIHQIGETEDGRLFIAMPFYEGETLRDKIARGPLEVEEALDLARQAARGLAVAHGEGLIHRDIKPGNLIVPDGGALKILDFGVAKTDETALTDVGVRLGTPAYMSPEQTRGEDLDEQTDFWSLGVVLYEMLTGRPPFRGDNHSTVIHAIRHDQPEAPERLRDDIPADVITLVRGLLSKDPAGRREAAAQLTGQPSPSREVRADGPWRLFHEIHQRSLWQVLGVYLGGAWLTLSAVDMLEGALNLPEWASPLAPVMLIAGLLVVVATAFVQGGVGAARGHTPQPPVVRGSASRSVLTWRNTLFGGITAALVWAGVAIGWLLFGGRPGPGVGAPTDTDSALRSRPPSLAVLPLKNYSESPGQDYLADGMTDELITTLTKIEALRVIAHQSVRRFKDSELSVREIADSLGVTHVVGGSVLRDGEQVRITASLIDAETDTPIWEDRFQRGLGDVMALQREVALAIAREIEITLTPEDEARLGYASEVDPEAFDFYVKGTQARYKLTPEAFEEAAAYFEQAIAQDSSYAPAWAGLAWVLPSRGKDAYRASEYAERAVELDPGSAEAHVALGLIREFHDWDWVGAGEAFRQAIRRNPGHAEAHLELSMLLMRLKRFDEALREAQQALYLAPMSARFEMGLGQVYHFSGRYDEALETAVRARDLDSDSYFPYLLSGWAFAELGQYETAVEAFNNARALGCDCLSDLGYVHAVSGRRAEALTLLETLEANMRREEASAPYDIAVVYAGLGDREQALDWLERTVESGAPGLGIYLGIDLRLRSLHEEPRFQALLEEVGL
jgi:serine/threonine protein kinase/TolB-like protein/Flp pilus assembly protein TadD